MPLLFQLQFSSGTFLWLSGCLILGILYALLLYGSSSHLSRSFRNLLFALRTLAIAILSFLLFAPLVKKIEKTIEKPLIIIAQDNSASILVSKAKDFNEDSYRQSLKELEQTLSKDFEVRSMSFGASINDGTDYTFNESFTDISALFKAVDDRFTNRNIGALILASDGIYNRGGNPYYQVANLKAPVYTIALGDTVPKKDLLISNVNYNNITFLDNQFQLEVTIEAYQAQGSTSMLTIKDESGNVFSQQVNINSDDYRLVVPVMLLAKRKGIQQYTIHLSPISNELSVKNNTETIFVEVIDGREKVIVIANSPHPDLTALKQSIETSKNYSVKISMADQVSKTDIQEAGVIILHQLPSLTNNAQEIFKLGASKPLLLILGSQSNIANFSALQPVLSIAPTGDMQESIANFNTDFYAFTLSEATKTKIQNFAPLLSPSGNYRLKSAGSVLINQQIGRLVTKMPLLVFNDEPSHKVAVLAGEGLWRWRLEDFHENSNHEAVDELIIKAIQFLSVRNDRQKFRVYSTKNTFDENESVILNAELYNDAYELVNTPDVNIDLKSQDGKSYSFIFSRTTDAYILDAGILPSGSYNYSAKTVQGKDEKEASGKFVITQQQAEFKQTRANHQLLYTMAAQSNGQLILPAKIMELPNMIKANESIKTIWYEDRKYEEPIDIRFVFFLILILLSIEWFIRKRNGEI